MNLQKSITCRSKKLRSSAKGRDCLVRIPGSCNFNNETVILAHIGGAGMGVKSNDIHGAFCCSSCHDALDGRVSTHFTRGELKLMHYEGIERTQDAWVDEGMIVV